MAYPNQRWFILGISESSVVIISWVNGVTFAPGYPANLVDLARRCRHSGPVPLELRRDLDNAEDLNATAVEVEGRHLGWVPRDLAARLAPELD